MSKRLRFNRRPSRIRLFIKGAFIAIPLLLVLLLVATPPLIMKSWVNQHVDFSETHDPSEFDVSANKIGLTTEDGVNVVAYEVAVEDPRAIVVFLSGIHNPSVTAFFGHAKLLADHQYGSILLEMRAHGESEGNVITLGYEEPQDVKAVVDYIKQHDSDVPVLVFGLSMGGATAINAIGNLTDIAGLISLSAYSSWEDAFCDNMINMGAPTFYAYLQKPFVKLYTTLKYGLGTYSMTPKHQIKKLGSRPALLIHSVGDSQVPFASFMRLIANAPAHVEVWVTSGDNHMILQNEQEFFDPARNQEYAQKILGFLNTHF